MRIGNPALRESQTFNMGKNFLDIPPELRFMIWDLNLAPYDLPNITSVDRSKFSELRNAAHPTVWWNTCRELRLRFLRQRRKMLLFDSNPDYKGHNPACNLTTTTLYFGRMAWDGMTLAVSRMSLEKRLQVRSVAIDFNKFRRHPFGYNFYGGYKAFAPNTYAICRQFPRLERLVLIPSSWQDSWHRWRFTFTEANLVEFIGDRDTMGQLTRQLREAEDRMVRDLISSHGVISREITLGNLFANGENPTRML